MSYNRQNITFDSLVVLPPPTDVSDIVVSPVLSGLHLLKTNFHQILCVLVVEVKIMPVHEFGILTKYLRKGDSG